MSETDLLKYIGNKVCELVGVLNKIKQYGILWKIKYVNCVLF